MCCMDEIRGVLLPGAKRPATMRGFFRLIGFYFNFIEQSYVFYKYF